MEASSSIPPQKTEDMESQKQTRSTDQQPKLIMPLRWRWPDMTVNKIVPAPRFFELPEGWRFEMRPRTNEKYVGTVDKDVSMRKIFGRGYERDGLYNFGDPPESMPPSAFYTMSQELERYSDL